MKVLVVVGTRPEAIKMAPVIRALREQPGQFDTGLCLTAQHRDLLDQVTALFGLTADYDLDVMKPGQSLFQSTAAILLGMEQVLNEARPDAVLVHGDTTTAFAAALAAFYKQIPVGHVEAGLRTANIARPFPEEMNRRLGDQLSTWHFAPTECARENLLREGVPPERVVVTGNTVVDALLDVAARPPAFENPALAALGKERRLLLITAHRRESFGPPFAALCRAIRRILEEHPDIEAVYPVHPNPAVRETMRRELGAVDRLHLVDPVPYQDFVHLMQRATLILTDSGGVQEEAPTFGTPVLVLRDETERPEAVAAGIAQLVGTDEERIVSAAAALLDNREARDRIAALQNPYGDGKASGRIVARLAEWIGQPGETKST